MKYLSPTADEAVVPYSTKYYRANKQKCREHQKTYKEKNKDTIAKYKTERLRDKTKRAKHMLSVAKSRARKKNIEISIGPEDILIPDVCPILGVPIDMKMGMGQQYYGPSLDRIDNSKGYVKGNVQVISRLANSMKSCASPEELKAFAQWVLNEIP